MRSIGTVVRLLIEQWDEQGEKSGSHLQFTWKTCDDSRWGIWKNYYLEHNPVAPSGTSSTMMLVAFIWTFTPNLIHPTEPVVSYKVNMRQTPITPMFLTYKHLQKMVYKRFSVSCSLYNVNWRSLPQSGRNVLVNYCSSWLVSGNQQCLEDMSFPTLVPSQ